MKTRVRTTSRRRGTILIVALIVTLSLSASVLVLCRNMRVEAMAAANRSASMQVEAIERGAEQYVLAVIADQGPEALNLSEDQFAAVPVGDGYFWVLRPDYDDDSLPIFGLVDEASKLNINTCTVEQLMNLPGMVDQIAGSIVDWHDEDNNPGPLGVESEYYATLPEPYQSKNARYETVEELLLVKDVTRKMLYGDGTAPPLGERTSVMTSGGFVSDPQLARGLYDLLTPYSRENTRDGNRVNVNDQRGSRDRLRRLLTERISASRAEQILAANPDDVPNIFRFFERGQMTAEEIDAVSADLTTSNDRSVRGLINVLTAPRAVLLCLPNIQPEDVDKLIAARTGAQSGQLGWIVDALGAQAASRIGGAITTRTFQYSADILAVTGNGRVFQRVRLVIDTRNTTPRIYYRRDLTDRGWPMDPRVLASLRNGEGPGSAAIGIRSMGGRS